MPKALQRNIGFLPLLAIRAAVCRPPAYFHRIPQLKLCLARALLHHELCRCITTVGNQRKWDIKLDISRSKDSTEMTLPMLIYVYTPWKYLLNQLQFWQLKLLWDHKFVKSHFLQHAKTAAALVTKMIVHRQSKPIDECTTPMGFKQIQYDMFGQNRDQRLRIMFFDRRHIQQVIPLKVQMLRHYNHKFAYVDVLFVAVRAINDFDSHDDFVEVNKKLKSLQSLQLLRKVFQVPNPLMVAEIFIRFRRDYAPNSWTVPVKPGPWLVSTYKILNFNLTDFYPEIEQQVANFKAMKY